MKDKGSVSMKKAGALSRFTLLELLIVIAIIAMLAAMLLPALKRAKESVHEIACINNLKQITCAFNMYIDDYNGWMPLGTVSSQYPVGGTWFYNLNEYVKKETVFTECRQRLRSEADKSPFFQKWFYYNVLAYGAGGNFFPAISGQHKITEVSQASQKIIMGDSLDIYQNPDARGCWITFRSSSEHYPDFRHGGKANFLYVDGHVKGRKETITFSSGELLTYWASFYVGSLYDPYLQ